MFNISSVPEVQFHLRLDGSRGKYFPSDEEKLDQLEHFKMCCELNDVPEDDKSFDLYWNHCLINAHNYKTAENLFHQFITLLEKYGIEPGRDNKND